MFIALFILGICVVFLGLWVGFEKSRPVGVPIVFLGIAIYVASFFFADWTRQPDTPKYQPIEYPASEYRLKLRIVEFEGQRDTTYVLVEKLDCLSTNYKAN